MNISLAKILHSSSIQSPSYNISLMVGIKYSLFLKTFSLMIINFALKFRKLKLILSGHLRLTWILKWTDGIVEMLCFDIFIYPECQNMRINGWYSKTFSDFSYFYLTGKKWMTGHMSYSIICYSCKIIASLNEATKMYQHFHKILNGQA